MKPEQQYRTPLGKWILSMMNARTFISLGISQLAVIFSYYFNISLGKSFALFSLVVAFPLVFSMQSAFKRRDRALEYLSMFKGAIDVINETFKLCRKLPPEDKLIIKRILDDICDSLMNYLSTGEPPMEEVYAGLDKVYVFMDQHRKEIGSRVVIRITRYMKEVHHTVAYLISFTMHRTMVFLRKFAYFFINVFPFIQVPLLINLLDEGNRAWLIYIVSGVTALTLITFYNVQKQIENPFDQVGLDDIRLEQFKLRRSGSLVKLEKSKLIEN